MAAEKLVPVPATPPDRAEHRRTCSVCSTLGVTRTALELTFREFTPGGEIIELKIRHEHETLDDRDIRWVLAEVASKLTDDQSAAAVT